MKVSRQGIGEIARRRLPAIALGAILLTAAVLRLIALDRVPPGPSYDELQNARLSERVLANQWALYFPENFGQEPLYPTLTAGVVRLLGWSVVSLRLVGALAGVLSVLALYLAGRELTNRRTALLAAAFHAVSFWSLIETRIGLETALLPPLSGLAVFFLARGLNDDGEQRRKVLLNFAVAGVLFGCHVYAYTPGRVMPLLPVPLVGYLLLVDRPASRRGWPGLLTLGAVTILIVAPLALFLGTHPSAEVRLEQLAGPLAALRNGDFRPILEITVGTLGMFTFRGEPQWLYNVADRPVFDPVTSILFYVGIVWSMIRLRNWRHGLLLIWLLVGISPGMASPPAASFTHTLAAQPAVYLVLGQGVDRAWRWLSDQRVRAGLPMALGLLALNLALSCRAYFGIWATSPEVRELYQGGVAAVARRLDAEEPPGPVAAGGPYVGYWHPWNAFGFELALQRQDLAVRWFDPASGWIWPSDESPTTYFFPVDPLGPQEWDPELKSLFLADAAPLPSSSNDFQAFLVEDPSSLEQRLDVASTIAVNWPMELANVPEPALPLAFDRRFALLGAELENGAVKAGEEVRLTTYWRVIGARSESVIAFVHITSDGQDIWGQHDGLGVRPSTLEVGDRFVQVHRMSVKPETPSGTYHLQLGLYKPDSLVRLPIDVEGYGTSDRVWIGSVEVTSR